MQLQPAASLDTVFGLGFRIERVTNRESGFKPALSDSGGHLFADLRLEGFAALIRTRFAERLEIVGGDEDKGEAHGVNRAVAIRDMLIKDFCIDPRRVIALPSRSNTNGNIGAIQARISASLESCALVTSHYHIPRVAIDLDQKDLRIQLYPAEALWLLEDSSRKHRIIEQLGGGILAERIAEEVQGIADKIRGTYCPRSDTPPQAIS